MNTQAVPYSVRATYIEPILLPSAVDVSASTSKDVSTIYYFEVYLNQKVTRDTWHKRALAPSPFDKESARAPCPCLPL